ncbi:major facilitator superfamily domain-containing protein [Pisolithus orientalis]|uniref:major facilitator superfamily domain-containing protein n=1 Tax=Pisolithus orientalis TaxID=936130 RepID=UPI0022255749|nr:major facilitator superfamily domain-containing protein [Pisolithus orientalis]KAI6010694.1 major facilitator superfamily domain-containing protein [Pisolithus orientalis]
MSASLGHTVENQSPDQLPLTRRLLLLSLFCLAQFLDAFNMSTVFAAMPALEQSLHVTTSQSVWIVSAYQLTFASTLLVSGRVSDVYNPKFTFAGGIFALGLISLGAGFANSKVILIVLRGLSGIASAMTIPSALTLLANVFPHPVEQARAIGIFGGCGAVADVLGFLVGAMFAQWASYRLTFWFVGIIAVPAGIICMFVMPRNTKFVESHDRSIAKWRTLDIIGVSILTAAIILFIFAVTSGPTQGWDSPVVLVSFCSLRSLNSCSSSAGKGFSPQRGPAIPSCTWHYKNFPVLMGLALLPFLWWTVVFTIFMKLWQDVFHWSAIAAAVHMLPVGMIAFTTSFSGGLARVINPKWITLLGLSMLAVATTVLALAGGEADQYWPFVFPALLLGSAGAMLTFIHTNLSIFQTAPVSMSGTVGAMFNGALQIGSAVGLSAVTSIESAIEARNGGATGYHGRAAAFWFLLGVIVVEMYPLAPKDMVVDHASTSEKADNVPHDTEANK